MHQCHRGTYHKPLTCTGIDDSTCITSLIGSIIGNFATHTEQLSVVCACSEHSPSESFQPTSNASDVPGDIAGDISGGLIRRGQPWETRMESR